MHIEKLSLYIQRQYPDERPHERRFSCVETGPERDQLVRHSDQCSCEAKLAISVTNGGDFP